MDRLPNKVAVVTGASAGIGEACARALLAHGMIVVGLARRHQLMDTVLRQSLPQEQRSRFHAVRCDVRLEEDIQRAFAWIESELGPVHVLLNNAGIVRQTQIVSENNTNDLRAVLDTNIMGVALCTREAFGSMKRHSVDGNVILICGLNGHTVPQVPGLSLNLYPATKYALTAMTEVLRQEFLMQQTNIKVTSISPGAVCTEIIPEWNSLPAEFPLLHPADVAAAVLYCLQTPPNVQVQDLIVRSLGGQF